jgi:hypothetical protein
MPKLLPRWLFQSIAVPTLIAAWGLWAELWWTGWGPIGWLAGYVGMALAGVASWAAVSIAWIVAILPLRLVTDFPSLAETMAARGQTTLAGAIDDARRRGETGTPGERRKHRLMVALVAAVFGIASAVGVAVNLELFPDRIFVWPIVVALVSFAMVPVQLVRAALVR